MYCISEEKLILQVVFARRYSVVGGIESHTLIAGELLLIVVQLKLACSICCLHTVHEVLEHQL